MDDGVTKFDCDWRPAPPPPAETVRELCAWRQELHRRGWIGHDREHGVGFGNLSTRDAAGQVWISGTQTGHVAAFGPEHVARVTDYDLGANRLACEGPVQASSEALTHLALYDLGPEIGAVIHVHAHDLWAALRGVAPTTDAATPYGTPAMAAEIAAQAAAQPGAGLLVMGGHRDGIVTYGADAQQAGEVLLDHARRLRRP